MPALRLCLTGLLVTSSLSAQSVTGSYRTTDDDRSITVTLREDIRGGVSGLFSTDGMSLPIEASVQNGRIVGAVVGSRVRLHFEARWEGNDLILSLQDLDIAGRPRPETMQQFRMISTDAADNREEPAPTRREPIAGTAPPYNPFVPNPLSPYPYGYPLDPLIGRFSDGYLTLDLTGGNDRYTGSLVIEGVTHQVTLSRRRDGNLEGGYWDGSVEFPVIVTPTVNGVSLTSEGQWFHLPRLEYGRAGRRGGGRAGGPRSPYGIGPIPWPLGGGIVREGDFAAWLVGKAVYFPDISAIRRVPGVYSRRVYHLCRGDELLLQDYEAASVRPEPVGPNRRFSLVNGTWQLAWNDVTLDLELALGTGFVDRLELTYEAGAMYANGEEVYLGFSDLCP